MLTFTWKPGLCPEYATTASSGADIKAAEDTLIAPGSCVLVPTGVWIQGCDEILDIQIRAKSSLFRKFGCMMVNGVGTVDCDYRQEFMVPLFNLTDKPVTIPAKVGIAQIVINPVRIHAEFVHCEQLRIGGFGSTDRDRGGVEL